MKRHSGCPPWLPVQTPNADLLPGCRVCVKSRPSWGTGTVLDVADQSLVLIDFAGLGRAVRVGRGAIDRLAEDTACREE